MDDSTISVLLIEDNPGDARLLEEALTDVRDARFRVEWLDKLATGLTRLADGGVDVLLLDLSLPDSSGFETFTRAYAQAPEVPILVLTGFDDDGVAVEAVKKGAQDYLVKGRITTEGLARSIRYAIERHRLAAEQRKLALIDELTGLHNRRGFELLCQQQAKLAARTQIALSLLFIDLDDFKPINDTLGHAEGDRALVDLAAILRKTFRESDVMARLGGDEFCVLLTRSTTDAADMARSRLDANVKAHNETARRPYQLALSVGVGDYDPLAPCSMEDLLAQADRAMYQTKQTKKGR